MTAQEIAAYLKELGATLQYSSNKLQLATREQAVKDEEKTQEIKQFFMGLDPESTGGTSINVKSMVKALQERGLSRKKNKLLDEQLKVRINL